MEERYGLYISHTRMIGSKRVNVNCARRGSVYAKSVYMPTHTQLTHICANEYIFACRGHHDNHDNTPAIRIPRQTDIFTLAFLR